MLEIHQIDGPGWFVDRFDVVVRIVSGQDVWPEAMSSMDA